MLREYICMIYMIELITPLCTLHIGQQGFDIQYQCWEGGPQKNSWKGGADIHMAILAQILD